MLNSVIFDRTGYTDKDGSNDGNDTRNNQAKP